MPRYYFNVIDGRGYADTEGVDLPDVTAAQRFGIRHAGEVLREDAERLRPDADWYLEITDAAGHVVLRLDFRVIPVPAHSGTPPGRTVLGYHELKRS